LLGLLAINDVRGFFYHERLDVLRPRIEGLAYLFRVAMPLINSSDTTEGPTAVVQCQLKNMRSNAEPLEAACEASEKIMKCPWSNCRSDFVFAPVRTLLGRQLIRLSGPVPLTYAIAKILC
jgi:hypothetical protein